MISKELYAGSILSNNKFDKLVNNSKGESIEDLTKYVHSKDYNQKKLPLSRSISVRRQPNSRRSSSLFSRRHSLAHATIQLKYRLIEELNRYIEIHKMQPLLKDITLYKKAQKHAKNLAITRSLRRDNNIRTGLLMGIVYYSAASVMVKKWYDEGYKYDYSQINGRPGFQGFTQLIWKETRYVGIGIATNKFQVWIVFKFFPKSNINGRYRSNINRPSKHCVE
uniref:SCP domain-containing protein n=1 Tax=Strongyloides papillosus TaxID=174720 RepID=A0A0N5BKW9_STREA